MNILSDDDLFKLTGFKIGSKQISWIEKFYGFSPGIKKNGHPSITEQQVNRIIEDKNSPEGPNWSK